jgi:hypothetical protein
MQTSGQSIHRNGLSGQQARACARTNPKPDIPTHQMADVWTDLPTVQLTGATQFADQGGRRPPVGPKGCIETKNWTKSRQNVVSIRPSLCFGLINRRLGSQLRTFCN